MKHFTTEDFPLGITLITLGFPIELISRSTPDRLSFHFKREDGLDDLVQAFWRNEIKVEPKHFYLNQKLLKSHIKANH